MSSRRQLRSSSPLAAALAASCVLLVLAAFATRPAASSRVLLQADAPPDTAPDAAPPPPDAVPDAAPPPDETPGAESPPPDAAPDASPPPARLSPPPSVAPPPPPALGDPIKVQALPEINSNLAPNCYGNNLIWAPNSNVYKVLNSNLAGYYDSKVPQRPAGQDELFTYMIQVCNYLASVSTAPDGTRLCCRLVDIYGDFWATQNLWGTVLTGRLDYQNMPFNRGVNFTNVNATSQALLTNYTAWDPVNPIKAETCSLPASASTPQTCRVLTFSAETTFQTQRTSAWEITSRVALTATFSGEIPLVASASDSISVGASFNFSKSTTSTTTSSSSTTVSAFPSSDIEPGGCFTIASTKQQQTVTYQVRSRAPLAGPVFMYFGLSPSSPMNEAQFRAAVGWPASNRVKPTTSTLRLKGDPKFKVPAPVGKDQAIPQLTSVGNWNAPDVTMPAIGPYLNSWRYPSNIQELLLSSNVPGLEVTHPADYAYISGKLSGPDYFLARSDAVYVATAQDFVAAAEKLGFEVDDYHKSLVDNSTYTKVDNVDITTFRNVVWTRPCSKKLFK